MSNILFFSRRGAVAQLELKALIIVCASIRPFIHPSNQPNQLLRPSYKRACSLGDRVSALAARRVAVVTAEERWCRRALALTYDLCLCFRHQKKAEEAHRILEGLGPRVELVSEHSTFYCERRLRAINDHMTLYLY